MVKHTSLAATASLLLAVANGQSMYGSSSPVLQVDGSTYDSLIAKSNHTSIVEFYAPWCGHCKNLKPAYEKAAKSLTGLAKVAAVNCDEEMNKPFCGSMGVQGFPTLKIVRPGKKAGKPVVEDYQGQRSTKAIVDAVVDKIPNHVKRLKDADYSAWMEGVGARAILFTDKGTVSALLKSIAIDFLGGIEFAQIRDKETEAVDALGIEAFPTLVLLPGGGKTPITYKGELKKPALVEFLSQAAAPNPDPAPKVKKAKTEKTEKSKASKSSSKFAESSASQASKQAKADYPSQTVEHLEEDSTASPNPQVVTDPQQKPVRIPDPTPPIPSLQEALSLQQKCLNSKAGTCVLALLPTSDDASTFSLKAVQAIRTLSELHEKYSAGKRNIFPFYQIAAGNSQNAVLRSKLKLSGSDVEVIAINGKRNWWRHCPSTSAFSTQEVEDWVDAIRMGDSKKNDIPSGLVMNAADLPPEPVEMKMETPEELRAMKEQLKKSMPEGMDFEIEEVTDEDYERYMKQGSDAPVGNGQASAHDEL